MTTNNQHAEKADGKNGRGVECITQLSIDDVSGSICCHEDGVHLRKNERRKTRIVFQLLLDGRVALSGEVRLLRETTKR